MSRSKIYEYGPEFWSKLEISDFDLAVEVEDKLKEKIINTLNGGK